jgi:GntR family transcriptional regulator of gluconate operon
LAVSPPQTALAKPDLLPSAVADLLRERIIGGALEPGTRLVEASLAEQLDVSRGSIRDGLKLLGDEGLVLNLARRGTYVADLTPSDVREVYDVRAALEMRAVRLLVESGPPPRSFPTLRETLAQIERSVAAGDAHRAFDLDLAFHTELYRLSGNTRLLGTFLRLLPMIRLVLRSRHELFPTLGDVLREHGPLLEAIETGTTAAAETAADQHLAYARDLLVQHISDVRAARSRDAAAAQDGAR